MDRFGESQQHDRFRELVKESYKKVFNMAYRLSGNRTDAEDLTQEAFTRAWQSFDDYQGDRPFENWIFRIVTRLFLDLLRNRRRRIKTTSFELLGVGYDGESLEFEPPDNSSNPDTLVETNTLSEQLHNAILSLSSEQRLLITLADIEGVPYKDIADMLGKPVGTIRSRLHRTRKLIRHRMAEYPNRSSD
jgi:RNA polymerase sigma-70 factor (ECF subfamily)